MFVLKRLATGLSCRYGVGRFSAAKFCSREQSAKKNAEKNALFDLIQQKISVNGTISVADYMRLTIASPALGYYSRKREIFGDKGDFVTAPELNQLFGELIGVWCYYELANTGHDGNWQLIENGPGTGQLMNDVIRVLHKFKEEKVSIHLVEASAELISRQESLLCGTSTELINDQCYIKQSKTKTGIPIYWYQALDEIPKKFSVFISNEFLDALPVYQFKRDEKGNWHEVLVNLDQNNHLCFMLSKTENLRTVGLLPEAVRNDQSITEWELGLDAGKYVNEVADRIIHFGGFALLADYGHDGSRRDLSLRAYSNHKLVHPLENPGLHDITADVNFGYLKNLVADRTLVFGPIEQRKFLTQMGIGLRVKKLLEVCKSDSDRKCLLDSVEMLLADDGMGTRFKVLSLFPKTLKSILDQRGGPAAFAES